MKLKALAASVAVSGALLASAPVASAHHNDNHGGGGGNVGQIGLVNVAITDTNLNVTVPINAALALAVNVCNVNVPVNLAILGAIADGTDTFEGGTCESASTAFAGQELEITQVT